MSYDFRYDKNNYWCPVKTNISSQGGCGIKRKVFIPQLFAMIHCLEGNILVTGDEVSGNEA